jgi:glycosyltransferase involved in cell wall biosynthesis
MTTALAILCVRNEAIHMHRALSMLIADGLEVVVIDNDSSDGSREIAEGFRGAGVLAIERLVWEGSFSLSAQLAAKQRIASHYTHDWFVHVDADEWLQSPHKGQTLLQGIHDADAEGANHINFHECVFVPLPGEDHFSPNYVSSMLSYYFFQPHYPRLHRAWKRTSGLDNTASGGHLLSKAHLKPCQRDFILRHYIVLSQEHARAKYLGRVFAEEDLTKGWHGNRTIITEENLQVKTRSALKRLSSHCDRDFDLSEPIGRHFWQW